MPRERLIQHVEGMDLDPLHARCAQLVPQLCGVLHAPVGDAQSADPRAAESERDGGRGAPGAQDQDPLARQLYSGLPAGHDHPAPVGVVAAEPGALYHDGVHRPGDAGSLVQLVQKRDHRPFVGHGDVEPAKFQSGCALHRRRQVVGIYVQADVDEIQTVGGEGGVVHRGAQAVADGVPDQGQKPRLTADHASTPPPSLQSSSTRQPL
jgi:hypothetical protein